MPERVFLCRRCRTAIVVETSCFFEGKRVHPACIPTQSIIPTFEPPWELVKPLELPEAQLA